MELLTNFHLHYILLKKKEENYVKEQIKITYFIYDCHFII